MLAAPQGLIRGEQRSTTASRSVVKKEEVLCDHVEVVNVGVKRSILVTEKGTPVNFACRRRAVQYEWVHTKVSMDVVLSLDHDLVLRTHGKHLKLTEFIHLKFPCFQIFISWVAPLAPSLITFPTI